MSYDREAGFSDRAFRTLVWPQISILCGGGQLKSLELAKDTWDVLGGVDAMQVLGSGIRTIAQRTQRLDTRALPCTFTIRSRTANGGKTELRKRLDALDAGNTLPTITVQAYVYEKQQVFARAAVVHTAPFYTWVGANMERFRVQAAPGGNEFITVWWTDLIESRAVPFLSVERELEFAGGAELRLRRVARERMTRVPGERMVAGRLI